jgi:hypothetical protein
MGSASSSKHSSSGSSGVSGFPLPLQTCPFRSGLLRSSCRSPGLIARNGKAQASSNFRSPTESCQRLNPCRKRLEVLGLPGAAVDRFASRLTELLPANASPGVSFPLRDTNGRSPLAPGFPNSRYVPPSGFLNLSAACSSSHRAALFHAAATSRVPPSRGFPSRVAGSPHRIALPSWRWLACRPPSSVAEAGKQLVGPPPGLSSTRGVRLPCRGG